MYVQVVLFDGFDPLDVIAPYEVLWAGGLAADGALTVELVSAEGPRKVTGGSGGITLRATAQLDPTRADLIVVPGASGRVTAPSGDDDTDTVPILLARTMETALPALISQALDDTTVIVATVCGGLARAGDGGAPRRAARRDPPPGDGSPRSDRCDPDPGAYRR